MITCDRAAMVKVLRLHRLWLVDHPDGVRADMSGANLCGADLRLANLRKANLNGADLRGAHLYKTSLTGATMIGANLDYASWPLWCGSIDVTIDERIAKQLVYHALAVALPHMPANAITPELLAWANGFHRVGEVSPLAIAKEWR